MKVLNFWGQKVLNLGDRWRTNILKVHLQPDKKPSFSLNGKLLRAADKANVLVEVAFPNRYGVVISKWPSEWLKGERKLVKSQFEDGKDMDFFWHEVDAVFPRQGKKKETYQAEGQLIL